MIPESVAIVLVCLILLTALLRGKYTSFALPTLPLIILPLVHLLMKMVQYIYRGTYFGARPQVALAFTDLIAVAITCVLFVLFSGRIQTKRYRRVYLAVMIGYAVLLGWAYVFNSLGPLLH